MHPLWFKGTEKTEVVLKNQVFDLCGLDLWPYMHEIFTVIFYIPWAIYMPNMKSVPETIQALQSFVTLF